MSFAAPMALLFLGLSVPVILLYLLKQRRRRVQVSTLLFWDKILRDEQTVTSLTRLKKLLSLLLQLLFIALLAFALARPLLSGKLTGARRIVLLVDTSASMAVQEGARTRFELAREKATGVIRGMSLGDTLMLVGVAAQPDIVHPFTDSRKDLITAVDKLQLSHTQSDLAAALELLRQLSPDDRETHVYLVSDGAFEPVRFEPPEKTRFAYLRVGERSENVGITAFQVRPLPASPRDFQIHLELANETEQDQTVPLELRIGGRLIDAHEFTIPAGGTLVRTLRQFSSEGGEVEVALDFPDAFAVDNRAFAVLPPPRPIPVQLVAAANLFWESALRTDDEVALQMIAPEQYTPGGEFAVTIFAGWTPPVTPPGNSIFISDWPADLGLAKAAAIERPLFTEWDREHPIHRHLAFREVAIERAVKIAPGHDFQVLASSFEDPLLLLRETPERKTLVVTFDTLSTDLPLRVAFPILVANAIRHLAGVEAGDRWQNPPIGTILNAAEVSRFAAATRPIDDTAPLRAGLTPKGERVELSNEAAQVPVNHAGIYRGETAAGESFPLFAANLASPIESRIQPADSLPVRADQPIAEIKRGARIGSEPWLFLALLGLVLSATEWGLFHRRVIE